MPNLSLNKPVVYIIDDDQALCESLQWLLESVSIHSQIFNDANEFLAKFIPSATGCILLDIRMPSMSGLELQEQLNQRKNKLPVIFMTGHGDVPMAVRAMKAGAYDFVMKPFNEQVLLELLQKAIHCHQKMASDYQDFSEINSRFKLLTKRQREIAKLIVQGKMNKEVAYQLNISMKTVEMHRAKIMDKMRVKTFAELVKLFLSIVDEEVKT